MYVIPVSKVFAHDKNIKHDMVCQDIEFGSLSMVNVAINFYNRLMLSNTTFNNYWIAPNFLGQEITPKSCKFLL